MSAVMSVENAQSAVLPPGHALMTWPSKDHGDVKKIWDRRKPDEVEDARRSFNSLVKDKKYLAFHCKGEKGEPGERMLQFDPQAERMVLIPPVVGG